ncbi:MULTISPECIES: Hpt domain-containing protein [Thalassobaculum]|uniref:Hpt domain-containing protein n=1 Tax=Thalassobaculum litoreum DSM 18839 TaxID=1123362 RepID=A0A8G2BGA6_9PROT|nr:MULTISPECIES: Hpt domain-containing protein [Thalassobaculum]SDF52796.1 Hpt domain-containing protein [Thalassobaculum litoreum DSM 18839]
MTDKHKVEFIDNPNPIRKKVRVEQGADPANLIRRADKQVQKLSGEFEEIFAATIPALGEAMEAVRKSDGADKDALGQVRRMLHDLRGQAGTFGYPLVSQVGDSACKFIDLSDQIGAPETEVLGMHIDALKAISQAKIKGDGGPVGAELRGGLRKVILKYNDRKTA